MKQKVLFSSLPRILTFTMCFVALACSAQKVHLRYKNDFLTPVKHVYAFDIHQKHSALSNDFGLINLAEFELMDTIIFQHASVAAMLTTKHAILDSGNILLFTKKEMYFEEFVLSANRSEESIDKVAQHVAVIKAKEIAASAAPSTPDILQRFGGVLVQKSQGGGGSPVLRGFEANKVLLVCDGVRMNNAIYRGGHLQNALTIDALGIERMEILFGPSSVMYGSDALGGVIHFYTKDPVLSPHDSTLFKANTVAKYLSVSKAFVTHFDFGIGGKKWALLSSFSHSKFGDITSGRTSNPYDENWGRVSHFASNYEGKDTMFVNQDDRVQVGTAYSQTDLMQKVLFQPNEDLLLIYNLQFSTSSNIPRFDRLNDYSGDKLKYITWAYGPQKRLFNSIKARLTKEHKLFDVATFIMAHQYIKESRINRKFDNANEKTQIERVNVFSFNADFDKTIDKNSRLFYGFESIYNDVNSVANNRDVYTLISTPAQTRYPDGGSVTFTQSVFGLLQRNISKRTLLSLGVRGAYYGLRSLFIDTSFIKIPFAEARIMRANFTGSASMIHNSSYGLKYAFTLATGFRAPNVDDLGKVFIKDDFIIIPNDNLRPERLYSVDFSIEKHSKNVQFGINGYFSNLINAIVRRDFSFNGGDSLVFEGDKYRIKANVNANESYIFGGSIYGKIKFSKNFQFRQSLTYTEGMDLTNNLPLAHIPPMFGNTTILFKYKKHSLEFYSFYHLNKKWEDMDLNGSDNHTEAITNVGFPGWYTLNVKLGVNISPSVNINFAVENILDIQYKQFASGISAPGRNFVVSARATI